MLLTDLPVPSNIQNKAMNTNQKDPGCCTGASGWGDITEFRC